MSPTAKEMEIFRKNCQRDGVVYFDIESALRNNIISNLVGAGKSAPTRESLHAEWMAQEKYLDWSNFLLNKLTGEAGSPAPAPTIECGEGDTLHLLLLNEPGNLKQLVIEFLKWDGGEGSRAYDAHKYFMLREALRDLTALAAPAGKEGNNG